MKKLIDVFAEVTQDPELLSQIKVEERIRIDPAVVLLAEGIIIALEFQKRMFPNADKMSKQMPIVSLIMAWEEANRRFLNQFHPPKV